MKDLNAFAELHLSFSSVLANVVEINAGLYLLHADKTASATIEFDLGFLVKHTMCIIFISYACSVV